jgi:hypothetical protein
VFNRDYAIAPTFGLVENKSKNTGFSQNFIGLNPIGLFFKFVPDINVGAIFPNAIHLGILSSDAP